MVEDKLELSRKFENPDDTTATKSHRTVHGQPEVATVGRRTFLKASEVKDGGREIF